MRLEKIEPLMGRCMDSKTIGHPKRCRARKNPPAKPEARKSKRRPDQTASDDDVKWNCFTFRAGVNDAPRPCVSEPLTRSGAPIISTFPGASNSRRLWLKRKLRTGYWIFPFSMNQTPSRVKPVNSALLGSKLRIYQKRLTNRPHWA